MTEKPLHVRVAEALGWTKLSERVTTVMLDGLQTRQDREWFGRDAIREDDPWHTSFVPEFDKDWEAAGPLIEKYGINLERAQAARPDGGPYAAWRWAKDGDEIPPRKHWGDTALTAVCNLIVALKEAGKL